MKKTQIPGRRKQPAAFRRSFSDYTDADILKNETLWSEKELRKAYSELRSVARKRLIRIDEAGFSESSYFQNNAKKFIPLEEVKTRKELEGLVSDVAKFVHNNITKASEMRQWIEKNIKTIEETTTEKDEDTDEITKKGIKMSTEDFLKFDRFMKEWHKKKHLTDLDSGRLLEILDRFIDNINLTNWEIILNDFEKWKKAEIKTKEEFEEMIERSKKRIESKMNK